MTRNVLHHLRFNAMGCPGQLRWYAPHEEARNGPCPAAVVDAIGEIRRLDHRYSHYDPDSWLSRLQRRAARREVLVDDEFACLLNLAQAQFEESGGCCDVTMAPLTRLWSQAHRRGRMPDEVAIEAAKRRCGWARVHWDGARLRLEPGMALDLGGLVKEYAVDRAAAILRRGGLASACVDLGGDLHVTGPHPDGSPWRLGVRHPDQRDASLGGLPLYRGGLGTSGDYARCLTVDGRRYGHIVDPSTGWPARGLVSVSVVAPTCLLAGMSATQAILLGRTRGLRWLDRCGLHWLAMDEFGQVHCAAMPPDTGGTKTASSRASGAPVSDR